MDFFEVLPGAISVQKQSSRGVLLKKMFFEISKNSQENACARVSFLIKLQAWGWQLWRRCFPVNFVKFLRTPFFTKHLWWLLLWVSSNNENCVLLFKVNVDENEKQSTGGVLCKMFLKTSQSYRIIRNTWWRDQTHWSFIRTTNVGILHSSSIWSVVHLSF